jgi:hypothetical protein
MYRIYARPVQPQLESADEVKATIRRKPLPLLPGQLGELMSSATAVGQADQNDYPIFIDKHVVPQSVSESWQGTEKEGGAWLVGNLYQQPDPPEIFARIHTVLEAHGTNPDKDRLDLCTATYVHLQTVLEQRRRRLGKVAEMPLGFIHSHPFLPAQLDGHQDCRQCEQRAACTATSAFLSPRDAQFHTALFGAAPFAVQLVLGLTARAEFDLRIFCLDGCRFRERGFYLLDRDSAVVPPTQ